eukprot:NODE_14355_length_1114_cov_2.378926.p1 GENE.NODE_14355_length_1114_cov_2.378926~~NODE_14355_length_1114_cov_2.378926.p1  ORF type:complete len:196 (-),score=53.79 NODE_14355_length_1114_cov_2.378926:266-853(-)
MSAKNCNTLEFYSERKGGHVPCEAHSENDDSTHCTDVGDSIPSHLLRVNAMEQSPVEMARSLEEQRIENIEAERTLEVLVQQKQAEMDKQQESNIIAERALEAEVQELRRKADEQRQECSKLEEKLRDEESETKRLTKVLGDDSTNIPASTRNLTADAAALRLEIKGVLEETEAVRQANSELEKKQQQYPCCVIQ